MNDSTENRSSANEKQTGPEDIADILGKIGKWQIMLMVIIVYMNVPLAWYSFGMAFLAPNIDHWCARPVQFRNMSVMEWKNKNIPYDVINDKIIYSKCEMFDILTKTSSVTQKNMSRVPCDSWEYDHSFYKSTIVEKWNLVCERSWGSLLAKALHYTGTLITSFIGGQLADRFGRKTTFFLYVAWMIIFGVICILTPSFWMFGICRFLLSLGRASTFPIMYVLLLESVGKQHRLIVAFLQNAGWSLGVITLPGIVWLFRDTVFLELMPVIPYLTVLPLWWSFPESLHWLLSKGRVDQAEKIANGVAKLNNLQIENLRERLESVAQRNLKETEPYDPNKITYMEIIMTRNLRRISFILYFIWVVNIFLYYALPITEEDGHVDGFLFFSLTGIVEMVAGLFCCCLQYQLGRIKTQITAMMFTGITCLLAISIPKDLSSLHIALAMISNFGMFTSLMSIYLFSTEIYPTVVRGVGVGCCAMIGRIGSVFAPFVKEAKNLAVEDQLRNIITLSFRVEYENISCGSNNQCLFLQLESLHWSLPMGVFGVASIVGALLVPLLPETKDIHLADTIIQGEKLASNTFYIMRKKKSEDKRTENQT